MSHPVTSKAEENAYRNENFAGHFNVYDAKSVCIAGVYLEDNVVYRCARYFASKSDRPLFVETPSFLSSLIKIVDKSSFQIDYEAIVGYRKYRDNSSLTWGDRLHKGETILLPLSAPVNERWMLVVMMKVETTVYFRILDSMWCSYRGLHVPLTEGLVRVVHLMGGLGDLDITTVTDSEAIPLQQRNTHNLCGYHVIARVWMLSTDQQKKRLCHRHIDTIQRYIQYIVLTKDKGVVDVRCGDNTETEFVLEEWSRYFILSSIYFKFY